MILVLLWSFSSRDFCHDLCRDPNDPFRDPCHDPCRDFSFSFLFRQCFFAFLCVIIKNNLKTKSNELNNIQLNDDLSFHSKLEKFHRTHFLWNDGVPFKLIIIISFEWSSRFWRFFSFFRFFGFFIRTFWYSWFCICFDVLSEQIVDFTFTLNNLFRLRKMIIGGDWCPKLSATKSKTQSFPSKIYNFWVLINLDLKEIGTSSRDW